MPAVQAAKDAGIPVIAYDRLIEDPSVLYITFDNVGVGKARGRGHPRQGPDRQLRPDQGRSGRPERLHLPARRAGTRPASGPRSTPARSRSSTGARARGRRTRDYTEAWATETAQTNMEAIIDKAVADGTPINAVLAENDSTALGVAAALTGKNYDPYPPVSGQDGDPANLNNVAKGLQYVDVWKNANELGKAAGAAALALCAGGDMASLTLPDGLIDAAVAPAAGLTAQAVRDAGRQHASSSFILQPTPLTAENLQLAIDGGQITKDELCAGVDAATAPAACQ